MIGIYKITSKTSGKIYVGQSKNIKKRFYEHYYQAFHKEELGYTSILHQAIRKYGIDDFSLEVLEECTIEELDDKEIYWIEKLNCISPNGYNILTGGQHKRTIILQPKKCKNCGKEICDKSKTDLCFSCWQITQRVVERPTKEELLKLLKENNGNFTKVGKFFGVTDNAIRKWCKQYGLPCKSSDYKEIKEKRPIKREVYQLDKDTLEIINKYDSIAEAARSLGKAKGCHITEACQGKLQQAYGYKWKYADEYMVP